MMEDFNGVFKIPDNFTKTVAEHRPHIAPTKVDVSSLGLSLRGLSRSLMLECISIQFVIKIESIDFNAIS